MCVCGYVCALAVEIKRAKGRQWEWETVRKGEAVRYTINPYWLVHHRKLFTVGVCHITLLLLTPAVVSHIDLEQQCQPSRCVYMCVCVCECVCECTHGGAAEECSRVIPPSSKACCQSQGTHFFPPPYTHTHACSECVINFPPCSKVNMTSKWFELSTPLCAILSLFGLTGLWAQSLRADGGINAHITPGKCSTQTRCCFAGYRAKCL